MSFVHLHTHSHYSLLDGLGTIPLLVAAAKEHNMDALALTDHGVLYGSIEFYLECKKYDIKPILGIEAYLTDGRMTNQDRTIKPYHIILLAKNYRGYRNLLQLTTEAHLRGFYYKPRFDWELLEQYSEGLIALTGCLNGALARPIRNNDDKLLTKNLERLIAIFGKDNLYLELQYRPTIPDQSKVNAQLKKIGKQYGVPLVATNDVHYINTDNAAAHDLLLCLQTKSRQSDTNRMSYLGEDYSLISPKEMVERFSDTPEAIENTRVIAERCTVDIETGKIHLPSFSIPDNKNADDYLRELCIQGFPFRYSVSAAAAPETLINRLNYELEIIKKTGFADYFLIVQDFVNWAKSNGIMVGPGRGSAAGSIVSYLLNITNIDPITYKLLFERFLNPERVGGMPDIDIDFADTERERVLQYVEQKYGKTHVAQIITFGTMAARAAVRDVGRVMGLSYAYCDRVAKLIPMFTTLKDAIDKVEELQSLYEKDMDARRLLDMAQQLEGIARHTSTHACAVIITKDPLIDHVPLQYSTSDPDVIISQYSMHPVEKLGLLKMDFLGLKNLTILQTAIEIIEKTTGDIVNLDALALDDTKTFKLLQHGDTTGIFQLESDGMTRYLKKLKPTEIEDIIAMVSLYRPGPMEFIDDYIAGKQGSRKISYLHPKLAPILDQTYGIAVYQEQVLQIARDLAGFSYGEADILRKAVGKKIKKLLVEQSEKLIKGMIANDIAEETAKKIWDFILPFARYGFNRSHAASYAMIAYQTAYLKAHYPAQFMAALMTADQGSTEKIAKQVKECRKMNLNVLPPDVNESFSTFSVVVDPESKKITNKIRFGLHAVKNLGEHIAKMIIHERKKNGPFLSVEDFLKRIHDKDLNKKSLESLVKCGAFDTIGDRAQLLGNLDELLAFHKKTQEQHHRGQDDLFSDLPLASQFIRLKLTPGEPLTVFQKLSFEKELLGLYISNHPFKEYVGLIPGVSLISDLQAKSQSSVIKIAGILTSIKKIITKNGKPMLFATLEDSTGSIELIIFPKLLESQPELWIENTYILGIGKLSDKDGIPKILVEQAERLSDDKLKNFKHREEGSYRIWLDLPSQFSKQDMQTLKDVLKAHPGMMGVYIIINNGTSRKIKTTMKVANTDALKKQLDRILGPAHVTIEHQ